MAGSVTRLPAQDLELLVADVVGDTLAKDERTRVAAARLKLMERHARHQQLRRLVRKVEVSQSRIRITVNPSVLEPAAMDLGSGPTEDIDGRAITVELPFKIVRHRGDTRVVLNGGAALSADASSAALIKAVARGYLWRQQLLSGAVRSINEIAATVGVTNRYVTRLLRLGFLAPDIIAAILNNQQPAEMTVDRLRTPIPYDWNEQRRLFGFKAAEGSR